GKMEKNDTLAGVLAHEGLTPAQTDAIVRALHGLWDPRTVREGQGYQIGFDAEGQLRSFEYRVSPILSFHVLRGADGRLHGKRDLGGKFYGYGKVLAAEYAGRVGTYRAFWFQPPDGSPGGYYDEKGQSIVRSLLKTPLKFVRISSKFDRHRFHPILHAERAH